ncbi:unnamed protein product, partial [Closterium sp. Yama58-4]
MGLKRHAYETQTNFLPACLLVAFCLFGVWLFAKSGHPPPTATEVIIETSRVGTDGQVVVVEDSVDITETPDSDVGGPKAVFLQPDSSAGDVESFQSAESASIGGLSKSPKDSDSTEEEPDLAFEYSLCADKGVDFIPCLDNEKAIAALKSRSHYEHRERHCPTGDDTLQCLLPLPSGYKPHINWPESRDQIWYDNVPHPKLASYKADQNWVKPEGDKFIFPGGGTQFKYGATKYIEWLQEAVPFLSWEAQAHPHGARHGVRRRELRGVPGAVQHARDVRGAQGRARRADPVRARARRVGHDWCDGHAAPAVPVERVRHRALRALPRAVAPRGRQAAAGAQPPHPPRRLLRVVRHARVPQVQGQGARRQGDLGGDVGADGEHVLAQGGEGDQHGVRRGRDGVAEAHRQRLLRQPRRGHPAAYVPRGGQRRRRVVCADPSVHAPRPHKGKDTWRRVASGGQGPFERGAGVAGGRAEGHLRAARGGRVRRGQGALAARVPHVPHGDGDRVGLRAQRDGHGRALRRVRRGAGSISKARVDDERGAGDEPRHAAHHLRPRAAGRVPRLVRVVQHLPAHLRHAARRPPPRRLRHQLQ